MKNTVAFTLGVMLLAASMSLSAAIVSAVDDGIKIIESFDLGWTTVFQFSSPVNQVSSTSDQVTVWGGSEDQARYASNNSGLNDLELNGWTPFSNISQALQGGFIFSSGGYSYDFIIALVPQKTVTSHPTSRMVATPIPAVLPLFVSALAGLGFVGFRRRKA